MQVHKGRNSPTESIPTHALHQSRSKVQRRGGGVAMWRAAIAGMLEGGRQGGGAYALTARPPDFWPHV